jgi:hypothetical protein
MTLENERAEERMSMGQVSERAVCMYEAVSVAIGARRPPPPAADAFPQEGRRRRRLAITAKAKSLSWAPENKEDK